MINVKEIEIIRTSIPMWPVKRNGNTKTYGVININGEYYGKFSNTFSSSISNIDLLYGDKAIVFDGDDQEYPIRSIKYLGTNNMPTTRLGEKNVPIQIWVINNRNIHYNRVGWAHVNESSYKIPLSIFEGQINYGEICDGLQLVINDKYEYDVIEEIKNTEQKNENGDTTYKSIWYSKSADKELLCVNGIFNKEDLKDLFKK